MDVLANLASGFAVALTPQNLLYAAIGVTLGTAIGVLPGIGPALTIALLLPLTSKVDPTGAFIMFAGIYYGGMYGGSTTSILVNTPGETASVVTAWRGTRWPAAAEAGAALATAAIGSFVAGNLATVGADAVCAGHGRHRTALRAGRVLRVDGPGLHDRDRSGRALAPQGDVQPVPRSRYRPGRHRPADRPGALHAGRPRAADGIEIVNIAVGLFAVGEVFWVASHLRFEPRGSRRGARLGLDDRAGVGAVLEGRGCAAAPSASRSAACPRAAPRSRRSCPTTSRSGSRRTRTSGARAPSKAWPGPRQPTTPRRAGR